LELKNWLREQQRKVHPSVFHLLAETKNGLAILIRKHIMAAGVRLASLSLGALSPVNWDPQASVLHFIDMPPLLYQVCRVP